MNRKDSGLFPPSSRALALIAGSKSLLNEYILNFSQYPVKNKAVGACVVVITERQVLAEESAFPPATKSNDPIRSTVKIFHIYNQERKGSLEYRCSRSHCDSLREDSDQVLAWN